jgi:hypothetical protein
MPGGFHSARSLLSSALRADSRPHLVESFTVNSQTFTSGCRCAHPGYACYSPIFGESVAQRSERASHKQMGPAVNMLLSNGGPSPFS